MMARLAAVLVLAAAFATLTVAAQAAPSAPAMKIKVIGFSGIYKNSAHRVSAPNGGVLRRCDEPGGISVVVDVSNIAKGVPYLHTWSFNGKTVSTKTGTTGLFDAVPNRIYFGYRKALADGVYTWKITVGGKLLANARVTKRCA